LIDDVRITDAITVQQDPTLILRVDGEEYSNDATFGFGTTNGSATATLNIRNNGAETLTVNNAMFSSSEFSFDGEFDFSVESLESKSIPLVFNAVEPGNYSASLTFASNDPNNTQFSINLTATTLNTSEPISIAEARALPQGTLVTVAGWVTVTNQFSGPVYFQDETGGIAWYNNDKMRNDWTLNMQLGDSLIVTGQLGQFGESIQIINDINHIVFPEANRDIQPRVVTFAELNADYYPGELVLINGITFNSTGLFSGGTNYQATDASGAGQVRIDNFANIAGSPIPPIEANIVGIAGRNFQNRQLIPRFRADITENIDGPVILTAAPYESHATTNSITFKWNTETEGHSEVRYGTSSSLEMGALVDQMRKTEHSVTITGLEPATPYRIQIRSAADNDTSYTNIHITSTASPSASTGALNVYFNQDVNNSLATYASAQGQVNFRDQLITRINAAEQNAIFAFYSLSGSVGDEITDAIIAAFNRGIDVRVIVSGHTGNVNAQVTKLQNAGVPAVQSTGTEQQHNKFAVIDYDGSDPSRAWIVTSSWNATDDGTFNQFQNMVQIQDLAIARAYALEFNQMWGGSSGAFNASQAKFSSNKDVVNPSVFWIGQDSVQVRLHFSPQANTEAEINRALTSARDNIDLNLNLITRRPISNTMLARFNDGVKVRGAIGAIEMQGSEWEYLSSWADVHHFPQSNGLLHHKYAIIDGERTSSNSKVITGSHNWSANANNSNDENTLIIYSERVANEYLQEFAARYTHAGGQDSFSPVSIDDFSSELPNVAQLSQNYPNPFNPTTQIRFELPSDQQISLDVFDVTGRLVTVLARNQLMSAGSHQIQFNAASLASGVYLYRLQLGNGQVLTRSMTLIK
jgi:phosphatidylserine/phosphatidylglycerophosphate/cardiolipin synthase-like enzyme